MRRRLIRSRPAYCHLSLASNHFLFELPGQHQALKSIENPSLEYQQFLSHLSMSPVATPCVWLVMPLTNETKPYTGSKLSKAVGIFSKVLLTGARSFEVIPREKTSASRKLQSMGLSETFAILSGLFATKTMLTRISPCLETSKL